MTSQGLWYCLDDASPEKHGIKPHTWGLENPNFPFSKGICSKFHVRFQASNLSYSRTRGKIILQNVLRTGSNSCVWGRQRSLSVLGIPTIQGAVQQLQSATRRWPYPASRFGCKGWEVFWLGDAHGEWNKSTGWEIFQMFVRSDFYYICFQN